MCDMDGGLIMLMLWLKKPHKLDGITPSFLRITLYKIHEPTTSGKCGNIR